MKRFIYFIFILCALAACSEKDVPTFSLNMAVVELPEGDTILLQVKQPQNVDMSDVLWTSSDTTIAVVSEGIVKAIAVGQSTIVATYKNAKSACVVCVTPPSLENACKALPKSKKRGVSYSFSFEDDIHLLAPSISWSYNWGPDVTGITNTLFNQYGLDFYPMAWNGNYDANRIRTYKALNPQCEYLLAFNEPNLTDQCNYTPQQAAEHWPALKALADELDMKIVAPAMNYGTLANYGDPIVWLDEFFTLVPLDDVDAIAIHCYMGSASALKSYVERFYKYDKPIWMTEFCAWEQHISNVQAQMNFMNEAIAYMEADPKVEKYAWFIPRASGPVDSYPYMQLLTKEQPFQLSELGEVFSGLSSWDKSVWLSADNYILPNTYSALSMQQSIGEQGLLPVPHLKPTTDVAGTLQLADFYSGQWVEYQVDIKRPVHSFKLRYATMQNTKLELLANGEIVAQIELLPVDKPDLWKTCIIPLELMGGKYTIRLKVTAGNLAYNWFKFE